MKVTDSQQQAIQSNHSTVLIAAAGSGKTFTIIEKVAQLLQSGLDPSQLLITTYTKKAGEEIRLRLSKRLGHTVKGLLADTLHGIASSLLREFHQEAQLPSDFVILEGALAHLEVTRLCRQELLKLAESGDAETLKLIEAYDFHPAVRLMISLIQQRNNLNLENFSYKSILEKLLAIYKTHKIEKALLDFQDLETEFLKLISNPQTSKVSKTLQERFQWIIVDEFQDINPIQWKIISQIYQPSLNKLMIVGDPRQSIYRFRGADPSLFDHVSSLIMKNGGESFYLNDNFRSAAPVIDFVNQLSPKLFPQIYPDLICHNDKVAGDVVIHELSGEKMDEIREDEVRWVISQILEIKDQGRPLDDITLLFKTRNQVSRYEEALKTHAIPYQTSDGESLLEKAESITLCWALKKILLKESAFLDEALSYTPFKDFDWNVSHDSLNFLSTFFEKAASLYTTSQHPMIFAFQTLSENLIKMGIENLSSLVEVLEILRQEKVQIPAAIPEKEIQGGVKLMTIHGSKGLEFPIVFLCDIGARPRSTQRLFLQDAQGRIHLRDFDEQSSGLVHKLSKSLEFEKCEEIEKIEDQLETDRLLYVALTRAVEKLFLPLPPLSKTAKRNLTKGTKTSKPLSWKDYLHEAIGN